MTSLLARPGSLVLRSRAIHRVRAFIPKPLLAGNVIDFHDPHPIARLGIAMIGIVAGQWPANERAKNGTVARFAVFWLKDDHVTDLVCHFFFP